MKLYFIGLCNGILTPYHSTSIEVVQHKAQAVADKHNETVTIYEPCISVCPSTNGISLAEQHLVDIIEEPSRTLKQKQKTIPYKVIQRRADFIINFENGWELYRTNSTFNKIANMVMNGASEYDVLLDLILYLDKNPLNETK